MVVIVVAAMVTDVTVVGRAEIVGDSWMVGGAEVMEVTKAVGSCAVVNSAWTVENGFKGNLLSGAYIFANVRQEIKLMVAGMGSKTLHSIIIHSFLILLCTIYS